MFLSLKLYMQSTFIYLLYKYHVASYAVYQYSEAFLIYMDKRPAKLRRLASTH